MDTVERIGFGTVVTIIAITILIIPIIIESWKKLLQSLGLISKKTIDDKKREQEILNIYNKIDQTYNEVINKQLAYRQQSIEIRNQLISDQENIKNTLNNFQNNLTEISTNLNNYLKKDKEKTIATLRSSLWRLHQEFTTQQYVTLEGLKTFRELGKVYENAGGDDIYHEKLLPEVLALEIHYPEDMI